MMVIAEAAVSDAAAAVGGDSVAAALLPLSSIPLAVSRDADKVLVVVVVVVGVVASSLVSQGRCEGDGGD